MLSLKKTTLFGLLMTAGLLGACSQPGQSGTADEPVSASTEVAADTSADTPGVEPAKSAADAPDGAGAEMASADTGDAVARFINKSGNVAIEGTDPVAYFTEGAPVAGSEEFAHEWNGAQWHFSSAENRDLFAAEPEKYAPQYGGHCAWAAAQGYVADMDPTAWSIVDDRLYLNYDARIQARWERDIPGFIATADRVWPTVVEENL